jgi:hypothetical protein
MLFIKYEIPRMCVFFIFSVLLGVYLMEFYVYTVIIGIDIRSSVDVLCAIH